MKIYISGKITGDRRYKAKFREVEKKLAAAGHIVLNPATAPEGLRPVDYMRLCFAMMEAADVVLFMQDYQDSLSMLLMLIAKGYPLNEVVFYDTGMEFEAIYHTRDQMLPCLEQLGIKYTRLEPENPFLFDMLERPVCSKQKGTHQGYGWCGGLCRWGTTGKLKAIDRYAEARDAMVYVGIAADETPRLEKERKPYKLHPLAEWGMTEADALAYCYENGFSWLEGTIRLYDVLDRVSCWCCCNKNLRELRNMCIYLPEYWERLKDLQRKIDRPMKGYYKGKPRGVFELEQRFRAELEQEAKA